ncbi:MAG: hypothetical protein ACOCRK_06555 [bacterium]
MSINGILTNEFKEYLLKSSFKNIKEPEAIGSLYLGLSITELDKKSSLIDVTDHIETMYERQLITFSDIIITPDSSKIINLNEINFGPWMSTCYEKIKSLFITNEIEGKDGMLLACFPLIENILGRKNDELFIAKGNLEITLE